MWNVDGMACGQADPGGLATATY